MVVGNKAEATASNQTLKNAKASAYTYSCCVTYTKQTWRTRNYSYTLRCSVHQQHDAVAIRASLRRLPKCNFFKNNDRNLQVRNYVYVKLIFSSFLGVGVGKLSKKEFRPRQKNSSYTYLHTYEDYNTNVLQKKILPSIYQKLHRVTRIH